MSGDSGEPQRTGSSGAPGGQPAARELLRASPELADILVSLLLLLWPEATLKRSDGGRLVHLWLEPAPSGGWERLRELLQQLVERPEWRRRAALVREVSDRAGKRLEVLVPLSPSAPDVGAGVYGPFPDEAAADEFGERNATPSLTHDTFQIPGGWVVDLFEMPAAAWEDSSR